MFINDAFAAAAPAAPTAGSLGSTLLQLALILLIFYFFLIRPQQKKMKEHTDMVEALKTGDKVLLNGGIYGTVSKVNGEKLSVEIASNVIITVDRMSVSSLVSDENEKKKQPAKNKKDKK